ncbi:MAG: Zinc carboxypeptidase [Planctomycetaceae bacterium]|nr:Zinc carboxypeptidase [Planctomycetaceae bacterium]
MPALERCFRLLLLGVVILPIFCATPSAHLSAGPRRWARQHRHVVCPIDLGLGTSSAACGAVAVPSAIPSKAPTPVIPRVPAPEVVLLGYSVQGVPITMHVFGTQGRTALIFGAIHGSEPNSGHLARHLLDYLLEHPAAYANRRVAVIPVTNPDGLVRTRRLNEHQIDLNRNFPATNWKISKRGATFGGEKPASEPETQAIIKAVELLEPDRIVSIHAITKGRECNNYDGPGADLAEAMKLENGYRVAKTIGYPTPGSFGSWAGVDRQIPTITLELPVDLPGEECWKKHREALLAVIQYNTSMKKP